ncbi:helix-hairpin-helix domain-containing protein [Caulobacter segnis]|uniref:helix-hairpin-helix domain-containing protein n=1 Tax=Caulobacter segnis TaxID=88688 RepID=UPI00240F941A|nr:helix-hairpin-helix domain-containing protein [Caulobacter segnis]MDG2522975.1 helix-hairpin-helix domain-containing protein [Caulobacter segnis]
MASEFPKLSPDAERALHFPLGVVSPLWWTFGTAAAAGAAWWWMTRWTQVSSLSAMLEPTNLEALMSPQVEAAEAVVEAAQEIVETAAAPVASAFEPVEEVTLEALEQGDLAVETGAPPPIAAESTELADDLTRLVGVGPKLAEALVARGVRTFAEIAAWTEEDLEAVDRDLDLKGRAVRDAWVAQAKRFAEAVTH